MTYYYRLKLQTTHLLTLHYSTFTFRMTPSLQTAIQSALQAFAPLSPAEGPATPLREAALSLLDTLAYRSDKTIALPGSKPEAFLELIRQSNLRLPCDNSQSVNRQKI